jgi:hypothetical protein
MNSSVRATSAPLYVGLMLLAFGAAGCGGKTAEADLVSDTPSSEDDSVADGPSGSGSSGGGGEGVACPADTMPSPIRVLDSIPSIPTPPPAPKGGELPEEGVFEMESAAVYNKSEDNLFTQVQGVVRFRPGKEIDLRRGQARPASYRWTVQLGNELLMSGLCPDPDGRGGGRQEPYTFENDRLTLHGSNYTMVFRRRTSDWP